VPTVPLYSNSACLIWFIPDRFWEITYYCFGGFQILLLSLGEYSHFVVNPKHSLRVVHALAAASFAEIWGYAPPLLSLVICSEAT